MAPTTSKTAEEIRDVMEQQSYNFHSIPVLEEYVLAQVRGEVPYMGESVRYLLKLYQLFPQNTNASFQQTKQLMVARAMLLAFLEYPLNTTDYLALLYMIPPQQVVATKEPCATIQKCATLLEACQFTEFWNLYQSQLLAYKEDTELHALAQRSIPKLQVSILQTLSFSYQVAPTNVVLTALNLSSPKDIDALLSKDQQQKKNKIVEKVDANSVTFVGTVYNTKRQRVVQESVDFASISALMTKIAQS